MTMCFRSLRNLFPLITLALLLGCQGDSSPAQSNTLTVAVAANVQYTIKEIKKAFEKTHKVKVELIVGSSGKLTAQIMQGAPYDIFISANLKYPKTLYQQKFATAPPKVYAEGALVWWTILQTPIGVLLTQLDSDQVSKIAIANPKNAPYGQEAIRFLEQTQQIDKLRSKLVYGESIAQTNQFIQSGASDIGITALSVVKAPNLSNQGQWQLIDADTYQAIEQGIVITKHGHKNTLQSCQQFFDFLFSPTAQSIFKKYGYKIPIN